MFRLHNASAEIVCQSNGEISSHWNEFRDQVNINFP